MWEKGIAKCQESCKKWPKKFDNGNQKCKKCDYKCKRCENSAENCTKCVRGFKRKNKFPDCACKKGYFDNGVKHCKACNSQCKTCSDKKTCDSCLRPFLRPPYCLSS